MKKPKEAARTESITYDSIFTAATCRVGRLNLPLVFCLAILSIFVAAEAADAAVILAPSPTPMPTWSSPRQMATSCIFTALVASGNALDVVAQVDWSIQYARSTDEGSTWSNPVNIGESSEIPLTKPLAAEGSYRHLVFARENNLYYKRSTNSGATWGSDIRLATGQPGHFFRVSISALNGHVDVVWVSTDSSVFSTDGLFYRRSFDNGATWQATTTRVAGREGRIANSPGRPSLSAFGNTLHLTWTDERAGNPPCYTYAHCPEIYYSRSIDGGTTWEASRRLTFGNGSTMGRPDILALSASDVLLVYQDDGRVHGEEELYILRSPDNGMNWLPRRITNAPHESEHAMLAGRGKAVNLAWFDRRDGNEEIYSRMSTDAGVTWGPEERITYTLARSESPRNALTSNYAHIIYVENSTVYYTRRKITLDLPTPTFIPGSRPLSTHTISPSQALTTPQT